MISPRLARVRHAWSVTAVLVGVLTASPIDSARQDYKVARSPTANAQATGRIVAIADLHGDFDHTLDILLAAKLVEVDDAAQENHKNKRFSRYRGVRWIGGNSTLVQSGDIVDRGDYSRDIYQLFADLRHQAPLQGGRVVNIVGNHELMNIMGDFRYVSPGEIADYGGDEERRAAWAPDGEIGMQVLEEFEPFAVVGETLFVHAGLMPRDARMGVSDLRRAMRSALRNIAERTSTSPLLKSSGPFWMRRFAEGNERDICPQLDETLRHMGAKRMFIGHTQVEDGQIRPRCGGKIIMADTIISQNGYPMCWGSSDFGQPECTGSRSFVEFSASEATAVHLTGVGPQTTTQMRPLSLAGEGTGKSEL